MKQLIFTALILFSAPLVSYEHPSGEITINNLQYPSTHNSYKMYPDARITRPFKRFCPLSDASFIYYQHLPLAEQLQNYGVRHFEIDILNDPNGGLYDKRAGLDLLGIDSASNDPALKYPGFKVMHDPSWDFYTRCSTFQECLRQFDEWSDAHPNHLPIFIHVEAKNSSFALPADAAYAYKMLRLTVPLAFDATAVEAIDQEILAALPLHKIMTPDLVRGNHATLREAVLAGAWPTLAQARGKFMFMLDVESSIYKLYLENHPSLSGRMAFLYARSDRDEAAFILHNDPKESESDIIENVHQGFMVRTRADSDGIEAYANDTSRREAALRSGAHFVSTDFIVPEPETHNTYVVRMPGGNPARCNPIHPGACDSASISE